MVKKICILLLVLLAAVAFSGAATALPKQGPDDQGYLPKHWVKVKEINTLHPETEVKNLRSIYKWPEYQVKSEPILRSLIYHVTVWWDSNSDLR